MGVRFLVLVLLLTSCAGVDTSSERVTASFEDEWAVSNLLSSASDDATAIAASTSGFVVAGQVDEIPTAWFSADGLSWEVITFPGTGLLSVAGSPQGFVVATETDAWSSQDGRDWDKVDIEFRDMYDSMMDWVMPDDVRIIAAPFPDSVTGALWIPIESDVVKGFAVLDGDARRWEPSQAVEPFRFSSIGPAGRIESYAGSQYLLEAGQSALFYPVPDPGSTFFSASNGVEYVMSSSAADQPASLWYSSDGVDWTEAAKTTSNAFIFAASGSREHGFAFGVSVVGADDYVLLSDDGRSWTTVQNEAFFLTVGVARTATQLALVDALGNVMVRTLP